MERTADGEKVNASWTGISKITTVHSNWVASSKSLAKENKTVDKDVYFKNQGGNFLW
jgi:hypothetical protein